MNKMTWEESHIELLEEWVGKNKYKEADSRR